MSLPTEMLLTNAVGQKGELGTAQRIGTSGGGGGGSQEGDGLTPAIKAALMDIVNHVTWEGQDGQDYIDALNDALYPIAGLNSITAEFTQSGNIYDDQSIDDLESMLTVTAHYDDSHTETVNDYRLSGTLEAGTSIITVSYGGKATTFEVTVTARPHLGDLTVGTDVLIAENNTDKKYILIEKDANDNCVLLRKDALGQKRMVSSMVTDADYVSTEMDTYLTGTWLDRFTQKVIGYMNARDITYKEYDSSAGTSSNKTISRAVYLPSHYEMGFGGTEGGTSYLSTLKTYYSTSDDKTARIAKDSNNSAIGYWLRTAYTQESRWQYVRQWGDETYGLGNSASLCGYRPIISMKADSPLAVTQSGYALR